VRHCAGADGGGFLGFGDFWGSFFGRIVGDFFVIFDGGGFEEAGRGA